MIVKDYSAFCENLCVNDPKVGVAPSQKKCLRSKKPKSKKEQRDSVLDIEEIAEAVEVSLKDKRADNQKKILIS